MKLLLHLLIALALAAPIVVQAKQQPSELVNEFYRRVMHPTRLERAGPRFSSLRPYLGEDLARSLEAFDAYERACARVVPPNVKPYMLDQSPFFLAPDGAKNLESTSQELHGDIARVFASFSFDEMEWTDTVLLGKEQGRWVVLDLQWEDGGSLTSRLVEFASRRCAP